MRAIIPDLSLFDRALNLCTHVSISLLRNARRAFLVTIGTRACTTEWERCVCYYYLFFQEKEADRDKAPGFFVHNNLESIFIPYVRTECALSPSIWWCAVYNTITLYALFGSAVES